MSIALDCTTNAFQFAVLGHIAPKEALQALVCSDGTQLRIVPPLQDYPSGQMMWHLIPGTDSTGLISQVKVINVEPLREIDVSAQDQCQLVGRVIQLSFRQRLVLLKVTRPESKTLKLTRINPDPFVTS